MAGEPHQVGLKEHLDALADAVRSCRPVPAGRLFGLPELPDDDCWLDIAGAAALTGVPPKTITSWLNRGGPVTNPFPAPRRLLYRLFWPRPDITGWIARQHTAHPGSKALPPRSRRTASEAMAELSVHLASGTRRQPQHTRPRAKACYVGR